MYLNNSTSADGYQNLANEINLNYEFLSENRTGFHRSKKTLIDAKETTGSGSARAYFADFEGDYPASPPLPTDFRAFEIDVDCLWS